MTSTRVPIRLFPDVAENRNRMGSGLELRGAVWMVHFAVLREVPILVLD